jgi:hypothetical protein
MWRARVLCTSFVGVFGMMVVALFKRQPGSLAGIDATQGAPVRASQIGEPLPPLPATSRARSPRLTRLLPALAVLALAILSASPAPASATPTHFEPGTAGGQFGRSGGIAVNQSSGDVYLVDSENARLERFSAEGQFQLSWGWGVASGAAAPETCGPEAVSATCQAGVPGPGAGQFANPSGVAIDNSLGGFSGGDVYVLDAGNARVQKFAPDGEFLLMFGHEVNSSGANVCLAGEAAKCQAGTRGPGPGEFEFAQINRPSLAVDSSGTVYVGSAGRVEEFTEAGELSKEVVLPEGDAVVEQLGVDSTGDMYVLSPEAAGVRKLDPTGVEVGEPRDTTEPIEPETNFEAGIAVGPGDDLFTETGTNEGHHVREFDPEGAQVASFVNEGAAGESIVSMAYGNTAGVLYVRMNKNTVQIVPQPPEGPVVVPGSEKATNVGPAAASLGASLNAEGPEAEYFFEYGTSEAYGQTTPVTPLPGGVEDQPVSLRVTGLSPRTLYHYRVVVTSNGHTSVGPDATFTTLPPVGLDSESVSQVSSTSARFATVLNPLGEPTTYHFEYGTTTAYGTSVPVVEASAGSGSGDSSFALIVEGLTPGTTYHYRVVARNALGEVEGGDRVFTTQGAVSGSVLADGRAWEQVSPVNKQGASLEPLLLEGSVIQAAADGSAITYIATDPTEPGAKGNRSLANSQLISNRSGGVWGTRDITTANEAVQGFLPSKQSEYRLFSTDLSSGLVEPEGATPLTPVAPGEPEPERTPYRWETDGSFTPLVTAANVETGAPFGGLGSEEVEAVTATPDMRHVLLSSHSVLTPGFTTANSQLHSIYEWSEGRLQLVSRLPGPGGGRAAVEEGEATVLGVRDTISADGNRVVFAGSGFVGTGTLYLRDMALGETVQLAPVDSPGALFQTASTDDSKVFFTDGARLTTDSNATVGNPELYMCEVSVVAGKLSCHLKDLSVSLNAGEPGAVGGTVIGADETGRLVYFVAGGVLVAGATPGANNLYVKDTVTGETKLIAELSGADGPDDGRLDLMTSRVSPNGQFLAFMSQESLTGYDNVDAKTGAKDQEVFLYDHSTGHLRCASCDPSGARPVGVLSPLNIFARHLLVDRPQIWAGQTLAGSIPAWTKYDSGSTLYQSRYLSNSGRLFFNSPDALVPADGNGKEDVYEFEPSGPTCTQPEGCVNLMSGGTSSEESAFLDASGEGEDVFFLTAATLAKTDVDGALDVYDAHICTTAVPCPATALSVPPACSTTDSCRVAPPAQPATGSLPASATLNGEGNAAPVAAPKPKPKTAAQIRAAKLTKALKSCRKLKSKSKRSKCERRARHTYGRAK